MLVAGVTMAVTVSYAWFTISDSPVVNGIEITVSGGNTILLAPDVTQKVIGAGGEELTVHYPGAFSDTLVLSQHEAYAYLNGLEGLSPVSTADGVNWLLPVYDAETGRLASVSEFALDNTLSNANIPGGDAPLTGGHYAYLDFWIVSPGSEYCVRVSEDSGSQLGSFLVGLPGVTEQEGTPSGYTLTDSSGQIEARARVGFLVSGRTESTETMVCYTQSAAYDSRYKSLLGAYTEPGASESNLDTRFTIYEPSGNLHPGSPDDGQYLITSPLGYDGEVRETDISDRLTVQNASGWRQHNGVSLMEELFQTAVAAVRDRIRDSRDAERQFYGTWLQGQVGGYVSAGSFFSSTEELYGSADETGLVDLLGGEPELDTGGATDDVYITRLQRNTPQRIRMFIWLEGQDADCVSADYIPADSFALSIELAGATR